MTPKKYVIRSNDELEGYDIVEVGNFVTESGETTDVVIATCYDIDKVDALIDAFKAEDQRSFEEALNATFVEEEALLADGDDETPVG